MLDIQLTLFLLDSNNTLRWMKSAYESAPWGLANVFFTHGNECSLFKTTVRLLCNSYLKFNSLSSHPAAFGKRPGFYRPDLRSLSSEILHHNYLCLSARRLWPCFFEHAFILHRRLQRRVAHGLRSIRHVFYSSRQHRFHQPCD